MGRAGTQPHGVERPVRVSTLELFFDLVFVFTLTQFTRLLAARPDATGLAEVALLFSVTWYAYDSYAWLTNALRLDVVAHRLLVLEGMGGFMVMALAVPSTFAGGGLAFGVAFLVVIGLHGALYIRATSTGESRAMRAIAPVNVLVGLLVLCGAVVGGDAQWVLMAAAAAILWSEALFIPVEGLHVSAAHFVERHSLLVIVALGESVVVLGAGGGTSQVSLGVAVITLLGLGLSAALWWTYFRDEGRIEEAMRSVPDAERPRVALLVYGYLHFFLLFAVVLLAAGLRRSPHDLAEELGRSSAVLLASGTALFMTADWAVERRLSISRGRPELVAAAAALATIPLGEAVSASAQLAALLAIACCPLAGDW